MARKKADAPDKAPPTTMSDKPGELPLRIRVARRVALWGTVAALGVTASWMGYNKLHRWVEQKYAIGTEPPRLVIKERPAWMSPDLMEQITASVRPAVPVSAFDRVVLKDVYDGLLSNPDVAPWIEKVTSVRRRYGGAPGDTIEVDATFRAPIALIRWSSKTPDAASVPSADGAAGGVGAGAGVAGGGGGGGGEEFWMVDSTGILLPRKTDAAHLAKRMYSEDGKLVLRVIAGVKEPPPSVGLKWPGADVQAGLEMLRLLNDRPISQEILQVDVTNYDGRRDIAAPQLVLTTKYQTQIFWGRPVGSRDSFVEVSPADKLRVLERIANEFGRVDARRAWLDIRFDRVGYPKPPPPPLPTTDDTGDTSAASRGTRNGRSDGARAQSNKSSTASAQ